MRLLRGEGLQAGASGCTEAGPTALYGPSRICPRGRISRVGCRRDRGGRRSSRLRRPRPRGPSSSRPRDGRSPSAGRTPWVPAHREANPVPRRLAAPRESQPSKWTLDPAGAESRSARSSNRTIVVADGPVARHRHTYSPSGSSSAFRKARSRRRVLTEPQAISRSTCTSTSVVPA